MFWKQKLAVSATVSRDACADISIVSLVAGSTIVARVVLTAADGGAAVAASVSWRTGAGVANGPFLAGATILARIGRALVSSVVAVHTSETIRTLTQIRVDQIHTPCTWKKYTKPHISVRFNQ